MRLAKNMKTLITFFVSTLFVLSGFAQYGQRQYGQTVTINFNGNGNGNNAYRVVMDGTSYSSNTNNNNNNNGTWNRNTSNKYGDDDITINNVQPGQHSIQVYRLRNNNRNYGGTASPVYSSAFTLRQGYDATLNIGGNGQVQFTEKRNNSNNNYDKKDRRNNDNDGWRNGGNNNGGYNNGYPNGQYRTPMADYQFSQILQSVRGKWFQPSKVTTVRNAFNNTTSYFSTYQITQLLQLITSEGNRLELAKLSYRVVADPGNFTQVYSLFSSQNSRNELDRYIRGYRNN